MSEQGKFEEALSRLEKALDSFEVAATRVTQGNKLQHNLQEEINFLREDRSRMADELDAAEAKARNVIEVNKEVSARIDGIMHNIRALLGSA
jgi:FtsZ-binding cell division protein ZapB